MQTQPTVSFDGVPVDEAVRDAALDHVADLEQCCRDLVGCHVVVSQPHRHHRRGNLWSVRVEAIVPGADVVVNHTHRLDHAHEDVHVALRDAFEATRRRLEGRSRERRGEVKLHRPHEEGRILRVLGGGEYGFIAAADGREIYVHAHALGGLPLAGLPPGTPVRFAVEEGEEGPQAAWVKPIGTASAGPGRESEERR